MLQSLLALHGRISRVLIDLTVDVNPALLVCYDEMVPLLVTRCGAQPPLHLVIISWHRNGSGSFLSSNSTMTVLAVCPRWIWRHRAFQHAINISVSFI